MSSPGTSTLASVQLTTAQSLANLIAALKSPTSLQQKQQVLQILIANPQVLTAFMKHEISQHQSPHLNILNSQNVKKLLTALKSPTNTQQWQQVLQILKVNPQVVKAFMQIRLSQLQKKPPNLQMANPRSLKKLITTLKSPTSLQQQQQVLQILEASPQVLTAFMKLGMRQRQQKSPQRKMLHSQSLNKLLRALTTPTNPQQWQQVYQILSANPEVMKGFLHLRLSQLQQQPPKLQMSNSQSLKKLITTLKSPSSPQQQQQVLQILKANPQVMNAFMKHMLSQLQQQPPNLQTSNLQSLIKLITALKSSTSPQQWQQFLQILKANPQIIKAFKK